MLNQRSFCSTHQIRKPKKMNQNILNNLKNRYEIQYHTSKKLAKLDNLIRKLPQIQNLTRMDRLSVKNEARIENIRINQGKKMMMVNSPSMKDILLRSFYKRYTKETCKNLLPLICSKM
jgi:superfamily II helicase